MIDLKELRESARQVLDDIEVPGDEQALWNQIVELGWLLVAVPEEFDGLGLGLQGACVVHAELGRKLGTAPYLPAMLALDAICQSQRIDRASWLERLVGGDYVAVPLADAPLSIAQVAGAQTLTGVATAVQSADSASHVLVWSAGTVALVATHQRGVTVTERPTWDCTRRLFDVAFDNVKLDPELILATACEGEALTERLLTVRDFALAADAVGSASALLEMTVEYLQTRRQFGRPLAMFQALKHRCADLKTQIAGAEATLTDCLARYADLLDEPQAVVRGKMVRLLAGQAFSRTAEESLQLHGGIGMASEHPCHLYLKRSLLGEHLGRGDRYERDIADSLLENVS